jgi:hypothetical protein
VKANSIDPAQAAEDFVTGVIIKQYIATVDMTGLEPRLKLAAACFGANRSLTVTIETAPLEVTTHYFPETESFIELFRILHERSRVVLAPCDHTDQQQCFFPTAAASRRAALYWSPPRQHKLLKAKKKFSKALCARQTKRRP